MNTKFSFLVLVTLMCAFAFGKNIGAKPKHDNLENYDIQNDDGEEDDYSDEDDAFNEESQFPVFISEQLHVNINEGESATLPCDAEHIESHVVGWYKNKTLLFQDNIITMPSELKSHYARALNNSLIIKHASINESGEYHCKIYSTPEIILTHTVTVSIAPKILNVNADPKSITLGQHEQFTLTCVVTGVPSPRVTLSKGGHNLYESSEGTEKDGVYTHFYEVKKPEPRDSGVYQCMADNSVGIPAHDHVNVHINYKPRVSVDHKVVTSAQKFEATLGCTVLAHPHPIIEWHRLGQTLGTSYNDYNSHSRFNITESSHHNEYRSILTVKEVTEQDFGTYTCFAKNNLGSSSQEVELTPRPAPAKFVRADDGLKYTELTWAAQSHTDLIEIEMLYKNVKDSEWVKVPKVNIPKPIGNMYHIIQRLEEIPSGTYDTKLRSKNSFGWSEYASGSFTGGMLLIEYPIAENISRSSSINIFSVEVLLTTLALLLRL